MELMQDLSRPANPEVGAFIQTRAHEIDPSWQISASDKFNETRRQKRASKAAQERTSLFKKHIKKFVGQTKRADINKFDVDRQYLWKDVTEMATKAMEADAERAKFGRNPFRWAARAVQQSSSNLEMLMAFLPNGEFTSILCGALTLVFSAAKRLDDARNKILTCLESLPQVISRTESYVEIYGEDPRVWNAAESLYIGILDGIEGMLLWIDKSAFDHVFKALLPTSKSIAKVEETSIKKNIEDKVEEFREVVLENLHRKIGQQSKAIEEQKEMIQQQNKAIVQQTNAIRTLQTHLNGLCGPVAWAQERRYIAKSRRKSELNMRQLQKLLDIGSLLVENETDLAIMDAQNACPPELINHAMRALWDGKFMTWLQSSVSQILLINGNMHLSPEQEAASPLTVLSCILPPTVRRRSSLSLPLVYLCGQHTTTGDGHVRPSIILKCLNAQILQNLAQEDVDLSGINKDLLDCIEAQRLDALWALFRTLLLAAGERTAFVILDGISWVEEGPFAESFGTVVLSLQALVDEVNRDHEDLILKVLLTNPSVSRYGYQWLPHSRILEMEDVEHDLGIPGEAELILW